MPKKYQTSEFSREQENQIDLVQGIVGDLLDAMLARPEYLKDSGLKRFDVNSIQVHPSEVADIVAEYLSKKKIGNVYYPTHTELLDGTEWISDTFNDEEIYEKNHDPVVKEKKRDVLIVRPTVELSSTSLRTLEWDIRRQMDTGTVVIPCYCEAVMVPENIKVVVKE
jgi:nucleoside-diphosphate-sugar epimerase